MFRSVRVYRFIERLSDLQGISRFLHSPEPFLISKLDPFSTSTTTQPYLGRNGRRVDVLARRNDEEADDLASTNKVDGMASEQTWHTDTGAIAAAAGEN